MEQRKIKIAEKAIRELRQEIVKLVPQGGRISNVTLAKALKNLNSRIRHTGCSSKELLMKRDQISGASLTFDDIQISNDQHKMRVKSQSDSAKYASRGAPKV